MKFSKIYCVGADKQFISMVVLPLIKIVSLGEVLTLLT